MKLEEIEPSPIEASGFTKEQLNDAHEILMKVNSLLICFEVILDSAPYPYTKEESKDIKYLLIRPRLDEPTLWTHIFSLQKMFKKQLDKL